MSPPLISVLIPCYNQARYLRLAIESVLSQENAAWELLISDDASTDNSADIIREYAVRDPRIRFQIQSPNLGMAANWNWCLQQATGRYVKFLFGDDFHCAPDALAALSSALDSHPSAVLATSARSIVDAAGETLSVANELDDKSLHAGADVVVRCLLAGKNLIGEPSAVMFRREVALRGFDPSFRQLIDFEFYAHLLEHGDLAYVARPLCAFRRHAEQQTAVNQRTRAGEDEGLRLQLKYQPLIARYLASGGSHHAVRSSLFRSLYFARKTSRRSPESHLNERALMRQLSPAWYAAYWLHHRVTKPFSNLRKSSRRLRRASRQ